MHELKLPCKIQPGTPMPCGHIRFRRDGKHWLAHRWVAFQAWGECPEGLEVCHSCNTPACIELEHLRYGTRSSNNQDRKIGDAKIKSLCQSEADEIKRLLAAGVAGVELARRFGVSKQTISKIKKGQIWALATL